MSSRKEFCTRDLTVMRILLIFNLQQNNCWQSAVWQMLVCHCTRGESFHAHSLLCSAHSESAWLAQSINEYVHQWSMHDCYYYHRGPSIEKGCGRWSTGFSCWQCRERGGGAEAASAWEGGVIESTHNSISRTLQKLWCIWLKCVSVLL